jgi:hypothetical protein
VGDLAGDWIIGGFYNPGNYESLDGGGPASGNWGAYAIVDQQLMAPFEDGTDRLRGFLRIGYSPETGGNVASGTVDAGVSGAVGFFNRNQDRWGVGLVWTGFSDLAMRHLGYPEAEKSSKRPIG